MRILALGSVLLYESRVICQLLKPEQTRKFKCTDDVMYYRSWVMDKTQFMPPTGSMLTILSIMLGLQKMFNFSFVRMARAYKVHLHPDKLSSKLVKISLRPWKIYMKP